MKVATIDDIKAAFERYCGALNMGLVDSIIKNLPTQEVSGDAVEVVRCKDCRFAAEGQYTEARKRICVYDPELLKGVDINHYCSDGKRRE